VIDHRLRDALIIKRNELIESRECLSNTVINRHVLGIFHGILDRCMFVLTFISTIALAGIRSRLIVIVTASIAVTVPQNVAALAFLCVVKKQYQELHNNDCRHNNTGSLPGLDL